jgi:hypothetical protein
MKGFDNKRPKAVAFSGITFKKLDLFDGSPSCVPIVIESFINKTIYIRFESGPSTIVPKM